MVQDGTRALSDFDSILVMLIDTEEEDESIMREDDN